jgi:hypothetical protein
MHVSCTALTACMLFMSCFNDRFAQFLHANLALHWRMLLW